MTTATSHQQDIPRPFPLWRRLLYLLVIFAQATLILRYVHELDQARNQHIEDERQLATLMTENKRLRANCPPEPTSGMLANR